MEQTRPDAPDLGPAVETPRVLDFVAALERDENYKGQVCHVEHFSAREPDTVAFSEVVSAGLVSAPVLAALQSEGITSLYQHQYFAIKAVKESNHVCLTTSTSSGKSLAFAIPILEDFQRSGNTRALILFPTKALAQDQLSKLHRFFSVCKGLKVCTFDGDTPKQDREALVKEAHVFLTNPDMLHYTILATHARWRTVLETLRFVVLDEAHVYRGAFGTHVAVLLRRLRRVLQIYKAAPLFIACSATMRNSAPFFTQLVGLDEAEVCVVSDDASGRGARIFCLWNPPVSAQEQSPKRARTRESATVDLDKRCSAFDEAAWLLSQAMRRGHRTVCFLQVRAMVEVVLQKTHKHLEDVSELQKRVAGYRGGYAAADRRRLERRLFTGDLRGIVATNALELGIDIGDLDLTLHVGVPRTVASVWQQAGRAGRRGRPSAAVLVAMDAPLEQHFCRHPADFFQRTLEARLPDVNNPVLLHGHLLCAAAERPLTPSDAQWFGVSALSVIEKCKREGRLVPMRAKDGTQELRYCPTRGKKSPKEEVNLRDIDPVQYKVLVRGSSASNPIETLDQRLTFMRLHPGAIYTNQLTTYFVEELDTTNHVAWVVPRDGRKINYYTECREHSEIILGGGSSRPALLPTAGCVVHSGSVTSHWSMYGFRKKAKDDHRLMDVVDLSLPPVDFSTRAVWMDLPGAVLRPIAQEGHDVDRGGLHALEHAMMALAPLCCDLDASELTCQHTRRDTDVNRFLLLLYEVQKGGAGAVAKVHEHWETLLRQAVKLLEECPCKEGCPNCIVLSGCGDYNHSLDKVAAMKIGAALGLAQTTAVAPERRDLPETNPPVTRDPPTLRMFQQRFNIPNVTATPCTRTCLDLD